VSTEAPRRREKAADVENVPAAEDAKVSEPKKPARRRRGGRGGGAKAETTQAAPAPQAAPTSLADSAPPAAPTPQADPAPQATSEPQAKARSRARSRRRGPRRRNGRAPRPQVERVMLVHNHEHGPQIAVVEEGQVVEMYVARSGDRSYVGNIYLGRVQNVLPGMEASFVDIGESRNGVLYAGEVGIAGDEGDEIPRIETVLRSGQPILVQVTKDPMRSKGARLTALVSIAGRHLVLVPNAKSLGVSRRLPDNERTRLRDLVTAMRPKEHGLIVRTAAEGAGQADLERDLKQLLETWEGIEAKAKKANAPAPLYSEPQLELRVIRDLFNRDVARCVVDDPELEATLRSYVRATSPDLDHRLELYDGELPIFEEHRIAEQIRKSLDRRVWLPSGGHIVIDRTEAMTVIDVNTGKFVGKKTLEETVFHANKEAAVEVARQLRLRDIGGIIVIDFIDMEDASNREELFATFRRELEKDRTRTQVFEISPLGLVQMTRKNVSAGIVETFSDPCPHCEGRGILIHDLD
jgi:ribonuclease E